MGNMSRYNVMTILVCAGVSMRSQVKRSMVQRSEVGQTALIEQVNFTYVYMVFIQNIFLVSGLYLYILSLFTLFYYIPLVLLYEHACPFVPYLCSRFTFFCNSKHPFGDIKLNLVVENSIRLK